jgi:hypothetical protein
MSRQDNVFDISSGVNINPELYLAMHELILLNVKFLFDFFSTFPKCREKGIWRTNCHLAVGRYFKASNEVYTAFLRL